MKADTVAIHPSWQKPLRTAFEMPTFEALAAFLKSEKAKGEKIYPPGSQMFRAFDETPFENVKVIILGQDPYHGSGQANGLSFSVNKGVGVPPSLKNIFKEIHNDLGLPIAQHGDLTHWARQGVFLLNAILSVRHKSPASHQQKGWENFTDEVIRTLSKERTQLVFMLWGKFAQSKTALIDTNKHLVLTAPHPSPFSAARGFFGCGHFSKANDYLAKNGKNPIDWELKR